MIIRLVLCNAGAAVTTRGSYYPPGKEAGSDKLHLLVEAPDQMALTKAKGEIKRIVGASQLTLPLYSHRGVLRVFKLCSVVFARVQTRS